MFQLSFTTSGPTNNSVGMTMKKLIKETLSLWEKERVMFFTKLRFAQILSDLSDGIDTCDNVSLKHDPIYYHSGVIFWKCIFKANLSHGNKCTKWGVPNIEVFESNGWSDQEISMRIMYALSLRDRHHSYNRCK